MAVLKAGNVTGAKFTPSNDVVIEKDCSSVTTAEEPEIHTATVTKPFGDVDGVGATVGAAVVGPPVVGAIVVGAIVVGAIVVGAIVVGAIVVGAIVVGAIVVGAIVVGEGATVVGEGATVVGIIIDAIFYLRFIFSLC